MRSNYQEKTLLCRTHFEGKEISGRISFLQEKFTVKLVGFESFIHFKHDESITLQLEDNRYCTVETASKSPGRSVTATGTCYYQKFEVTQAIIGFRPWSKNDRVKYFYFKLSDVNGMLDAPDIKNALNASKVGDDISTKIVDATSTDAKITISYGYSFDWLSDTYIANEFYGTVEFNDAKDIDEIEEFVGVLNTFFTMASASTVLIKDYWILPVEDNEQSLLGGGSEPAPFQLIWPRDEGFLTLTPESNRTRSLLRCTNEEDRLTVSKCLTFWIDNWNDWKPAFQGIFLATQAGDTYNTHRIINACKWLEATPGAEQKKINIEDQLSEISNVANSKALELGLDLTRRLDYAIKKLNIESRRDVWKRLIDDLVTTSDDQLKRRFRSDVNQAFDIRNRFAHDTFEHESNEDFGNFVKSTMAVETLAFLMLYRNLPLPANHQKNRGPGSFTEYLYLK